MDQIFPLEVFFSDLVILLLLCKLSVRETAEFEPK